MMGLPQSLRSFAMTSVANSELNEMPFPWLTLLRELAPKVSEGEISRRILFLLSFIKVRQVLYIKNGICEGYRF